MAEAKTGNNDAQSDPATAPLNSWKEIAGYLKIDVRTCQRWEQSLGLPVHRLGNSPRSRVIAYPAEIEEWRKNTLQSKDRPVNGETTRNGDGLRAAINGNGVRPKFKPKHLLIFLVPVLAVTAAFLLEPYFDRNPADFRIEGPKLIVLNKHNRALWAFNTGLSKNMEEAYYRTRFPEKSYKLEDKRFLAKFPRIIIRDLDGDGRKEVLFAPQTADDIGVGELYLLDARGKTIWKFETGKEVQVGDRRYSPEFVINLLGVVDVNGDGRLEIVVGAHGYMEAPTRLLILDMEKRILAEYWNFGQFSDFVVADHDGDGRREIIAVGTNNEYDQACLVVLDPAEMTGASPQGPAFRFAGLPEGAVRYYVRFATPELELLESPRGIFTQVRATKYSHLVALTINQFIWYDFDREMQPPQITVTDSYVNAHREAVRNGLLSGPLDLKALKKELAAGVLYYDGESKTWVNRRAMASSGGIH